MTRRGRAQRSRYQRSHTLSDVAMMIKFVGISRMGQLEEDECERLNC